jgi:hypothetical protein
LAFIRIEHPVQSVLSIVSSGACLSRFSPFSATEPVCSGGFNALWVSENKARRQTAMASIISNEGVERLDGIFKNTRESEADHLARGMLLSELPGLVFAILTAVWVVSSFCGLHW